MKPSSSPWPPSVFSSSLSSWPGSTRACTSCSAITTTRIPPGGARTGRARDGLLDPERLVLLVELEAVAGPVQRLLAVVGIGGLQCLRLPADCLVELSDLGMGGRKRVHGI